MSRIEFTRVAGAAIAMLAAFYIAYLHWQWIAGGPRPDATLAAPAFALCLGLVLVDASRLAKMGVGATAQIWAGWGLLTAAVTSAATVWGAIPWNPDIAIAWVFSAAFAVPGFFMRHIGIRTVKPKRKLISAADADMARNKAMTGSDDWTLGYVEQEAARDRSLQPIRIWTAVAFVPAILGYLFEPLFYFFASVPGGIALVLVVLRQRDRKRVSTYGVSRLYGDYPIPPGAQFEGRIEIPQPPAAGEMAMTLRCLRIYRDPGRPRRSGGRDEGQGMKLDVLHDTKFTAQLTEGAPGEIAFAVDIPQDARWSTDGGIIWELKVAGQGLRSYAAQFRLPVKG